MFQFANPHILWLLLTVPAMVIALMAVSQLKKRNIAKFGNPSTLYALMPDLSNLRVKIKSSLFLLAVTAVIFAAARPQFGSKLKEQTSQGIEMMLVVDISNSMLAEDFAPNRLDRTRYAIDKLFASLNQDRVGMVVFAGEAKVQLPITTDYRMARSFTKRISPTLVSVQGTEIGQALNLASLSFSQNTHNRWRDPRLCGTRCCKTRCRAGYKDICNRYRNARGCTGQARRRVYQG